jgi:hypothetical protein
MTYQEYKAELLWIQVTEAEISATLNHIQRKAIDLLSFHSEGSEVAELCWNPYDTRRLASYKGSIHFPFCCEAGELNAARNLLAGMQELVVYRARLAHWFWGSRVGVPPVFTSVK